MNTQTNQVWQELSSSEFAALGMHDVAYVKPKALENGRVRYAIHMADGAEVAIVAGFELAQVTVRQNEMEPLSVH